MQSETNDKITNKNYAYTWRLNNMLLNDAMITEDIREEMKKFLEVMRTMTQHIKISGTL